jgi:hypothetical protein
MADNQVTLEINVDSKDAQAAIELFGKESAKVINKTEDGFGSLGKSIKKSLEPISSAQKNFEKFKDSFIPITAIVASITAAFRTFSAAIEEVNNDTKDLKQINFALQATDEATNGAVQSVLEFADALRAATAIDDGLIKNLFTQAKAFGVSTDRAKELTKAAIDLSAATGQNVETALKQLGGTLDGSAGRINNLGAEFRNLSDEQLKNGAAIDLVNKKYGGAAAAGLNTFEGATNQLSNAMRDVLTEIGRVITENETLINSIKLTSSALVGIAEFIPKFFTRPVAELQAKLDAERAKKFVDQIELVGNSSQLAAPKVKSLVESLSEVGGQSSNKQLSTFGETLNRTKVEAVAFVGLTGKAAEDAAKKIKEATDSAQKFVKGVISSSGSALEVAAKKSGELFEEIKKLEKRGLITSKQAAEARVSVLGEINEKIDNINDDRLKKEMELNDKILKDTKERIKEEEEATRKSVEEIRAIAENPISVFFDTTAIDESSDKIAAAIAGGLNQSLDGKSGAVKALSGLVSGFVNTIVPGLGPVFGSIFEKLTQGPEATRAFVKEFLTAIPDILQAVIESLPEVTIAIFQTLLDPNFWAKFVKGIVQGYANSVRSVAASMGRAIGTEFLQSVQTAIVGTFENIANKFTSIFSNIVPNLGAAFANLGNQIASAISSGLNSIFQPLLNALQPLTDALFFLADKVQQAAGITGKGGGEGIVSETLGRIGTGNKGLKFANGGLVPDLGLGRGDTVPMFMPNELIVPTDLVGQLASFLATQNSGGGTKSDAILMGILQAVQQPITVNAQAKVNQSAFADIILQLNRQNARLSA